MSDAAFGPLTLPAGEGVDIATHGHAQLATVTYLLLWRHAPRGQLGNDVIVEPGDVAWKHAGAGIVDGFGALGGSPRVRLEAETTVLIFGGAPSGRAGCRAT